MLTRVVAEPRWVLSDAESRCPQDAEFFSLLGFEGGLGKECNQSLSLSLRVALHFIEKPRMAQVITG